MSEISRDELRLPFLISGVSCLYCLLILNFIHIYIVFLLTFLFLSLSVLFLSFYKNKIFFVSCFSCFISCLIFTYKFYTKEVVLDSLQEKELTIVAYATDLPEYHDNYCKYIIKVEKIENLENVPKFKMELLSSDDMYCEVLEKFKVKIKVRSLDLKEKIKLKSQDKYLSGVVYSYHNIERLGKIKNLRYYILNAKQNLIDYTVKIFDTNCANFLRAILFRDRSKLTAYDKDIFSKSGIFHFLAISGFHFSIMIKILLNLFKFLKFRLRLSLVLCCVFIIFFMIMTGFTPSIIRSGVMIFVHILAKLFIKKDHPLNSLSLALMIILMSNIDSCLDISLWMSFVSSSSLVFFSSKFKNIIFEKFKTIKNYKILNYILSNFVDSLIGTISVFPISCLYFKSFSLVFLISNLFVSFQIYILILVSIVSLLCNQFIFFENLPKISNFIVKSIMIIAKKLSNFHINLDYTFIPLCVSFILIIISYSLIFRDLKKDILKIIFMFLIFTELGMLSYQIKHINALKIDIIPSYGSNDIIASTQKENFIILQSDNINKIDKYLKSNKMIININDKIKSDEFVNIKKNSEVKIYDIKNNIKFLILNLKNKKWIKINIMGKIILISANGGDIRNLPENMRECDIFLAYKIPNKLNLLKFNHIIYADNSYLYRKNCNKIANYDNFVLSGYDGSIFFKDGKYFISRRI